MLVFYPTHTEPPDTTPTTAGSSHAAIARHAADLTACAAVGHWRTLRYRLAQAVSACTE
jgi:hypothetical protein